MTSSKGAVVAMNGNIWGIHMDASVGTKPVDEGYVGVGWAELGDLTKISPNRDAYKAAVKLGLPQSKPGSIPVQAGVLFRFVHELKEGDLIIYPSKVDRMVNIGKISGPYQFNTSLSATYPNIHPVKWLKHFPREEFSQAALYEIGSFISLFSVRKYSEEFLSKLEGREIDNDQDAQEFSDDEIVTQSVATQAEETTQDFIIRQLKTNLTPYQFEYFVAHLLECMGYHARVTQKSGDGGVDIIAHRDELGFEPPLIKVQCKQVINSIGRPEVTQLFGNVESSEHGLFVTLGSYTKDAREFDRSKPNLRLLDGEQLVALIFNHYENFDAKYQALLPLKRIFVPSLQERA